MDESKRLLPPGYEVRLRQVDLGRRSVELWQARDPDALVEGVEANGFGEDERFPYWAELWPSGVALARFVTQRIHGNGVVAVELGCGLGLAGIAAAANGARVLFTDFEPDALAFARANHALNLGSPGATRLVDWRHPPGDLRATLVLAADVLYERRFLEPFRDTLASILDGGGVAYIAEPGRPIAEGTVEAFDHKGFTRELHLVEIPWNGRNHGVWIHEIRPERAPPRPSFPGAATPLKTS